MQAHAISYIVNITHIIPQPAAAKKAPAKKAPLASKKNLPNDSITEDDVSSATSTPMKAKPPAQIEVDDDDLPKATKKTASEMYQKVGLPVV